MPAVQLALAAFLATAAGADITPATAIEDYCEPLLSGSPAQRVTTDALANGFEEQIVTGRKILISGELLISLSDSPRACFVQAPPAMTLEQGFQLADNWASKFQGAMRSSATKGPDGAPARGWSAPAQGLSLIATQQTDPAGRKVMAFIVMPTPRQP